MNIKYLRDAPAANEGDVVEIDEVFGVALIAMGFAEEVKTEVKPKTKTTKTTKKTTAK